MNVVKIEVWKSDNNREERHYFIEGVNSGYQPNEYVLGYNPNLFSQAEIELFLRAKGYSVDN